MEITKNKVMIAFLILMCAVISALLFLLIINVYIKASVKDRIVSPDNIPVIDTDCILVLGTGVWEGGRPSHMLEDRLVQAIKLYNASVSDRLLMRAAIMVERIMMRLT